MVFLFDYRLALKRNGALHILADKYEGSAGHFERMVELGEAAMNCKVTAEFNGSRLKVLMRKKAGYSDRMSVVSSASSHTTSSSNGSSNLNSTSSITNSNHRNSDQLNYDPTLAMMMPSVTSRSSSSSSSSPIVPSASYSPQLYN